MYDHNDIRAYCKRKGWDFKEASEASGVQLIVSPCPLCGEKGNTESGRSRPFYISVDTTKFNTYCCGEKGNLYTLKKRLGDAASDGERKATKKGLGKLDHKDAINKLRDIARESVVDSGKKGYQPKLEEIEQWHGNLFREADKDILDALINKRGLTIETIVHFRLGVINTGGFSYVTIPSVVDGVVEVLKMRNMSEGFPADKKWKRIPGMQSKLFNACDSIDDKDRNRIFVCESEFDCIAAWQMGMRPVVASTVGAGTFKDEWLEILEDYDEIVFLYDQFDDDKKGKHAGDDGAEKAAAKLGKYRCKRAVFKAQDVNEWFLTKPSQEEIDDVISSAVSYQPKKISRFSEFSKRARTRVTKPDIKTGIQAIDKLFDSLRENEITIVSADSSIGKTTLAVNIGQSIARTSGEGVMYWPIEGTEIGIVQKLWCQLAGTDYKTLTTEELDALELKHENLPFFIFNEGAVSQEAVHALVTMFVRKYGCKIFIIDHLHKLIQLLMTGRNNERELIDSWMGFLCNLLKEFDIHIICVVHPTKPKGIEADANFEPEMHDLKGSSSIYQDADNVLIIGRTRTKDRNSDDEKARFVPTKFIAKKVRSDDASEGMELAVFDKLSKSYMTIEECNAINGNAGKASKPVVKLSTGAASPRPANREELMQKMEKMRQSVTETSQKKTAKIVVGAAAALPSDGPCSWCDSGRLGEPCDICGRNGGTI